MRNMRLKPAAHLLLSTLRLVKNIHNVYSVLAPAKYIHILRSPMSRKIEEKESLYWVYTSGRFLKHS